jgi:hypothetical protein
MTPSQDKAVVPPFYRALQAQTNAAAVSIFMRGGDRRPGGDRPRDDPVAKGAPPTVK